MDTAKMEATLAALRGRLKQSAELTDELEAMMSEQATPGQMAKRLLDEFVALWEAKHRGQKYVVSEPARLMASLKRTLKALTPEDIAARMPRFLDSRDPFYVNARHPLPLFLSGVNKFGAEPKGGFSLAAPAYCQHKPACETGADCTRRQTREARA